MRSINKTEKINKDKSLPIQDEPEGFGQFVYDWDMRLNMNDGQLETIVRQAHYKLNKASKCEMVKSPGEILALFL